MTVYLLIDDTPDDMRIVAVYPNKPLAVRAMKVLKGDAGDRLSRLTWQYLRVERRVVVEKVTR